MKNRLSRLAGLTSIAALALAMQITVSGALASGPVVWSDAELRRMKSLWIENLPALPVNPSNHVGDDPRAVDLGHRLFFDTRLSPNGEVACASCHEPARKFTDGKALAEGQGKTARNAPTIIGIAHSPWFFWDGRKDSLWSQALGPLESVVEHGTTRVEVARLVVGDPVLRGAYEAVFGALPEDGVGKGAPLRASPVAGRRAKDAWDAMTPQARVAVNRIFSNVGKAIAAYERRIMPGPGRFDAYVSWLFGGATGLSPLNEDETAGLRLFLNTGCMRCHNGPLFTNNDFHNTGLAPSRGAATDDGRASGIRNALEDAFNCLGDYSDATGSDCTELRFAKTKGPELRHGFKVPTLRNLSSTAPYMHDGRFATLTDVLAHYNAAPHPDGVGSELEPLSLDRRALNRLQAFLKTLNGPVDAPEKFLRPKEK